MNKNRKEYHYSTPYVESIGEDGRSNLPKKTNLEQSSIANALTSEEDFPPQSISIKRTKKDAKSLLPTTNSSSPITCLCTAYALLTSNVLPPFIIFLTLLSCQFEEESVSKNPNLKLTTSNDTVLFDTLISSQGSITRRFRIYNPNKEAVQFSRIALGKGNASNYSLIINGQETNNLRDEVLLGKDSIQVLVSVFIDPQDQNLPYLVKDSVIFDWNGNTEHVKLVAYGQDAIFMNGDNLCDVTWTSDRPYVIYNYALVDTLCTLTIEPGTQIFLDNGAGIFVKGSLKMRGTKDKQITVKNTRFDAQYQQAPGQWDGIYFLEGSKANEINYSDISNGSIGLRISTPDDDEIVDVMVRNTRIQHMSTGGILAFASDVQVENTLIYNCGDFVVGNFAGGNYCYDHCTLVNEPNFFFREGASVQFSDSFILSDSNFLISDLNLKIRNTIIWGNQEEEMLITESGQATVTKTFVTSIVKSGIGFNNFFSSQELNFPEFTDPSLFDYTLDTLSKAKNRGTDIGVSIDLLGIPRDIKPDIGAHERVEN